MFCIFAVLFKQSINIMSLFEPQIEIIPELRHSALIKTKYSCNNVDVPWHIHSEIEIVYVCEGFGAVVVGDNVLTYSPGDMFILGSDLPHMFRSETTESVRTNTHIVIQFSAKMLNDDMMSFLEMTKIKQLVQKLGFGIKINGENTQTILPLLEKIVATNQFSAILETYSLLDALASVKEIDILSSIPYSIHDAENSRIGKIFHYVLNNYEREISVADAADIVNLSKPAFCNYFKKKVNKRFSEFVNELRVNKACVLLRETEHTISEICYMTGFSNLSYFNRYFLKLKGISPIRYRKNILNIIQ